MRGQKPQILTTFRPNCNTFSTTVPQRGRKSKTIMSIIGYCCTWWHVFGGGRPTNNGDRRASLHVAWEYFATWQTRHYISETAQDRHTVTMNSLHKVVCVLSNDDIASDLWVTSDPQNQLFGTFGPLLRVWHWWRWALQIWCTYWPWRVVDNWRHVAPKCAWQDHVQILAESDIILKTVPDRHGNNGQLIGNDKQPIELLP